MKVIKGHMEDVTANIVKIMSSHIRDVLKKKGTALIGLPGGNSIKDILIRLREENLPWENIEFFMVDERWVELDSKESNFRLLKEYFFDHIDIPEENIHFFDYKEGIENYNKEFEEKGGVFDLLILGVGEDYHVASLFPDNKALKEEKESYIFVDDSPKPPSWRVSVSKKVIENSKMCVLLIFGEKKRSAMEHVVINDKEENKCPAKFALKSKNCYVVSDL